MYKAIIIWDDGNKETYEFKTREDAQNCCERFKMSFGNQITWTGVC